MTQKQPKQHRPLALERGLALYAGGNLYAARVTLESVLVDHPTCQDALTALGSLHLELNQADPAYFYFSRALRNDAGNPVLLMQVAECQRALGDHAGADETQARALAVLHAPVAAAPAAYDDFEAFLDGIQLPPTALVAIPMPARDRGTQPLWHEPWKVTA